MSTQITEKTQSQKYSRRAKKIVENRTEENQNPSFYSVSKKMIVYTTNGYKSNIVKVISVIPLKLSVSIIEVRKLFKLTNNEKFIEFYNNLQELKPDFVME